ncbi:class I SAM-dependent methyltransferase [Candidatus Daviesbacteria bacterium]|nr:class I SAM-dependent methyltransferase [Candidatus Daviesbacteria bacterium]
MIKSIKSAIDSIWEVPIFYKLLQATLAGGGHSTIKKYLKKQIPKNTKSILDQGCGTGEYSLLFNDEYTGLDNSVKDIKHAKERYHSNFIVGTAAKMPFKNNSFDVIFAVGLHHHLSDGLAKKAILESLRVCKNLGKIIIIDAMLPKSPLNLIGLVLRKLDRGGHVRKAEDTLKLLPKGLIFKHEIISSFPFDYLTIVFQNTKA